MTGRYRTYHEVADPATEDMVARYEFEVDTTRAVRAWQAEVAENLARREATAEPS